MEKKLWMVVQTSDADFGDVGVMGIYDNVDAAYECRDANNGTVISLHHYPVQSTFNPEADE